MDGTRGAPFVLDPADSLTYALIWAEWLADGETITTATWTHDAELTREGEDVNTQPLDVDLGNGVTITYDPGTVASIKLTGGELHKAYRVKCQVVATDGNRRTDELWLECAEQYS